MVGGVGGLGKIKLVTSFDKRYSCTFLHGTDLKHGLYFETMAVSKGDHNTDIHSQYLDYILNLLFVALI